MKITLSDFIQAPKSINIKVKAIKGHQNTTRIGTVRWRIQHDNGIIPKFELSGIYYVLELPLKLLSLQHLARETQLKHKYIDGTVCNKYSNRIILSNMNDKYQRTIPLTQNNGIVVSPDHHINKKVLR